MLKSVKNFIQGLIFGVTGAIPAESGATIAIILGFYNEMIEAVNHFTKNYRKHIIFLLPLFLGKITGLVLSSSVIHYLLTNYSFPTMTFFMGLIVGAIPLVYKKTKIKIKIKTKEPGQWFRPKRMALILIPILVLLIMSSLNPISETNPIEVITNMDAPFMLFIVFVGALTGTGLVVPGISGSYLQLLLGVYPVITYSISSIRFLVTDITNISLLLDITKVLVPLLVGIIIGGIFMARVIEKIFKKHRKAAYTVILGVMLGSVYVLLRNPIVFQSGLSVFVCVMGIVTFLLGGVISFNLGFGEKKKKKETIGTVAVCDCSEAKT